MENSILLSAAADSGIAERSVSRSLEERRAAYADEIRRLIDATFDCIRRTGRLEPRVSEVVAAAGLSNKSFYRHFRSKDELLLAVLDEGVRRLADYLRDRMERAGDSEARVRAWLEGMTRQALRPEAASATRPFALSRGRLSELFAEEIAASDARLTALLREALEAGRSDGGLPSADPVRDALTLYDLAMGWLQRRLAEQGPVDFEDANHLVEFAMHGLRRN